MYVLLTVLRLSIFVYRKTNLMYNLSSVYSVRQTLHVSGLSIAHHQAVHRTYTTIGIKCCIHTVYRTHVYNRMYTTISRLCLKCDGARRETRFRLSAKRTSPFKPAGASVQSTTGNRGVRISGSNAGYTPCSEVV